MAFPTAKAANNIAFIKEVGSANYASSTTAKTLTITVPASGVAKGDTIIVLAGNSGSSIYASSASDSRGNTYHVDVHKSSTATSVNTTILSATANNALLNGDTIKVNFSGSVSFLQALATDWQGIVSGTGRLDSKASKQGNSTALVSGTTPTTTNPNELLIGSFSTNTSGSFRAGNSYTPFATQFKNQLGSTYRNQWQEYRLVSQTAAYSAAGNSSLTTQYAGAIATYKAADTTPPTAPTGLTSSGSTGASVSLSWNASTDDVAVTGYDLYVNGSPSGTTTSTAATLTGLNCGNSYTFGVDAYDAAGNKSAVATVLASTAICDTTSPTMPTNVISTSITANSISIAWSPSTDDVGVAGYGLYKNGLSTSNTTDTTATFSGLTCATTYTLGVDAYDAAGNRSAQSSIDVTTDVCDTAAPTVSITAPTEGSTVSGVVPVNADASDNVAVAGVQFKLDGVNLSSEDTSSPYSVNWSTASATSGSHSLTAVARDAAGNTTTSNTVNVTVSNISTAPAAMPVISLGKPVFASAAAYPASGANDADYSTVWRSGVVPAWLAYDLSSVPAAQHSQVLVAYYNDPITTPYDHAYIGDIAYNNLKNYTIELNAASGGTAAPTSGWVTAASVTGNTYHSRTHLVNMTGYNWIRINVTASDGSAGNNDAAINFDVHDASQGINDSWFFLGDSITQDGMAHTPVSGSGPNYSQLINTSLPAYFPAFEDAGIGGLDSNDLALNINKWLANTPAKYIGLSYGTNDANGCANTTTFYNNYVTAVQAVLAAGKIPVIPTIPASKTANVQSCGPGFNAQIQSIYANYPQVIKGPDLWAFFKNNPSLISGDNLHPSDAGYTAMRQQWANAMLANVYNK